MENRDPILSPGSDPAFLEERIRDQFFSLDFFDPANLSPDLRHCH